MPCIEIRDNHSCRSYHTSALGQGVLHALKLKREVVLSRDAGMGLYYGGSAPLTFERGGNGGTGALTYQYHK